MLIWYMDSVFVAFLHTMLYNFPLNHSKCAYLGMITSFKNFNLIWKKVCLTLNTLSFWRREKNVPLVCINNSVLNEVFGESQAVSKSLLPYSEINEKNKSGF